MFGSEARQLVPSTQTNIHKGHSATMSRVSPTLHQLAQAWPVDPLRPTVQFGQVLVGLSTSPNLSLRAVMATRALSEDRLKTQVFTVTITYSEAYLTLDIVPSV